MCYSRREGSIVDDNAAPECMLADKETEYIDKVGVESDIIKCKVIN